ncbi:hypothetical protein GCM10009624_30720 [Gordonia sinesedis]
MTRDSTATDFSIRDDAIGFGDGAGGFPIANADRSPGGPFYRMRTDGDAEALVVIDLHPDEGDPEFDVSPTTDTFLIREDGVPPARITPVDPARLPELTGAHEDWPDHPGAVVVPVPGGASVSYRIVRGDGPALADPRNADGAGELASLLTHPDAAREGPGGLDLWSPRPPWEREPSSGLDRVPISVRLDRAVLGRRATIRLFLPPARHPTVAVSEGISGAQVPERDVLPVVVLLDGDDWRHMYDAPAAFAAAERAGHLGPHVLVLVPAPADEGGREAELTGDGIGPALAGPVLDAVDRAMADHGLRRARTVVAAQSLGGIGAMRATLSGAGGTIDAVVAQSPSFWWPAPSGGHPLDGPAGGVTAREIVDSQTDFTARFTVGDREPAMRRHVDAVVEALVRAGADASCRTVPGGHDHAVWRGALVADVAAALTSD